MEEGGVWGLGLLVPVGGVLGWEQAVGGVGGPVSPCGAVEVGFTLVASEVSGFWCGAIDCRL